MAKIAIVKAATISEAKNGLSALLDRVKAGEAVLITDRGVPVARLEPVTTSVDATGRSQRLLRAGLIDPGRGAVPSELMEKPRHVAPSGHSLVGSVLEERRQGW